ncbi:MAG: PAS domain S-box protein [Acidobacteria bacterium]|nr:PAS domain S-box protein [Acidobacteriota bacterium]
MIDLQNTKQSGEIRQALPCETGENPGTGQSLPQSEEGYRRLFEAAPIAIGILDQKLDVSVGNPAMERITGYSTRELKTHGIEKLFSDSASYQKLLWSLSESGAVQEWEAQLTRKDGDPCVALLNIEQAKLGGQRVFFAYMRDITKRKRIAESLQESKERFRLIAESIDEVFLMSDRGKAVYVSPAFDRLWGRPRQDVCRDPELLLETIHPDDRERVAAAQATRDAGKPFDLEYRIRRPDGSVRYIWDRGFPVLDESGQIDRYVSVAKDITERSLAVQALKESEERYRTAIEHCNDGVAIAKETTNLFVNQRYVDMFGYDKPEDLVGKPVSLTMNPEEFEKQKSIMLRRQKGDPVPSRYEMQGIRKDGKPVDIEISATRTVYRGESVSLAYVRDITERKNAERENAKLQEQIRQSQKMEAIGVLAGGVAHDFNNLIMVINGYSDFLLNDLDPDDPRRKEVEQIKDAGQRAATLTAQLLAFSRKQMLSPKILDLNTTIEDMSKMLRRLIGEDIELVSITRTGLGMISADPGQIQQIIMNLVGNAREAMPRGGKITIETANVDLDENYTQKHAAVTSGPHVMLAISDNGTGMDEETQARVFEPFFSTKGPGKGTGLGLSTVYGIVKQSGGTIWLYSEPGKGTTFKIYFPRVLGAAEKYAGAVRTALEPMRTETVLVVEDEPAVRGLAVRILKKQGYKVLEASNGKDALAVARECADKIDLVLTDVVMPGMSGRELAAQMEILRPGIKSLYISGYTSNAIVHHDILDSNVSFLQKPFNAEALVRKVGEVIDSSREGHAAKLDLPESRGRRV